MNEIYYQKPPTVTRKDTIYNDQCPVFRKFDKNETLFHARSFFLRNPLTLESKTRIQNYDPF